MITIGNDFGGPELKGSPIQLALSGAGLIAKQVRDPNYNNGTMAWINPIFIVPGSMWQPEFEGHQLGHFSKKEKGLVVKIAVPKLVANGKGILEFIIYSLREAVKQAAVYFSSKGISFSTLKAEKIILELELRLREVIINNI